MPHPTLDALPGPLEKMYQASSGPDGSERPLVECRGREFTTGITELALERTACYGLCSMYTVVLRADGTATYTGRGNVTLLGEHTGAIEPSTFQRLAALAEEIGFMSTFSTVYSCGVTDNPTSFVSVVKDGQRKTIRHYAPDVTGPLALWWLEQLIDEVAHGVKWQ